MVLSDINPWLLLPLVFLCWVLVLSMLKKVVFAIVHKIASRTENQIDDLLLEALDFPVQLIVYASGLMVVNHLLPSNVGANVMQYLLYGFKIVAVVAGVLFVDKFMQGLIRLYAQKVDILRTSGGIAQGFMRAVVLGLGGLILLDTFGVSITPIIASLGIGSLAVALALQPTLENFFSGIQLVTDKPVKVGQYIRLESGEEGQVLKIGWRSTWIWMPANNTVVIPNKLLVNSRVTNYCYPDPEVAVSVAVGVGYGADLEQVERVTLAVAGEVQKEVEGGVSGFQPVLRFATLGEWSVTCNVVLRAKDMPASAVVRHEFIKRLMRRYGQEGITVPLPTRIVMQGK
ncbi:MAG: mechanosensitive ion channel family protein [Candidatus Omnitrophica bacterium]|nr:mechanosensitive ion channel family protein [Candidatus Omnitrophota bacterium]